MTPETPNSFERHSATLRQAAARLSPRHWAIAAVVLLVAGLAAVFLLRFAGQNQRGRPPAAVILTQVKEKDVTVVEHAAGTVIANTTVQVTAEVSGQLQRALFREGDIVKAGELLFIIDQRSYRAALAKAEAQLAKDRALLAAAAATKKRYDALFRQNAISSQQKDNADAAAESAAATVAADLAEAAQARIDFNRTEIRSPVNGKTGPILIQPGNLVGTNTGALVTITEIEPVKVSMALAQSRLPEIQARDKAGLLFAMIDAGDGKPIRAKIDFVSNAVSNRTGTIELRASVANKDHRLVPGQLVETDVALGTLKKTAVVPREAVNEGPNGRYVYVVDKEMVATMRPVTVLFDGGREMAVEGVKKGERVVIDGQLRIVPGAKVSAGRAKAASKARERQ